MIFTQLLSPFILRTQLRNPQFFQNFGHLQYNISLNLKQSQLIIENDHSFERLHNFVFKMNGH